MAPDRKYMTLEEVAELLGVNYQLIYKLVRNGELPAVRIGRIYRITETDLDAYLASARTTGGEGGACAACGKTYHSPLSLKDACVECGAPICVDCWSRVGVRHCREHAEKSREKKGKA